MGFITGLSGLTRTVTLHRHRQNDRGAFHLLAGGRIGCIDLVRVVATPIEVHDVVVAQILHQLQRLGILPEEVLPGVGTAIEFTVL